MQLITGYRKNRQNQQGYIINKMICSLKVQGSQYRLTWWLAHALSDTTQEFITDLQQNPSSLLAALRTYFQRNPNLAFITQPQSPFLNSPHTGFLTILHTIDSYLMQFQCKRLSEKFINSVILGDYFNLVALVAYISALKDGDILEFAGEGQELRDALRRVDSQLQDHVEWKQALQTLEELQERNERLEERLLEQADREESLMQVIEELRLQNKQQSEANKKYKDERRTAFRSMRVRDMSQYTQRCSYLASEQRDIARALMEEQDKNNTLREEGERLRLRIRQRMHTIADLEEQFIREKENYIALKDQLDISISFSRVNATSIGLRESSDFQNMAQRGKLCDRTNCSWLDDSLLQSKIKCNELNVKEIELLNQIRQLKNKRDAQSRRGRMLQRKLKQIWEVDRYYHERQCTGIDMA